MQNSAVIRLEIFQMLNHRQGESRERENLTEISSSTRKDMGSKGEKQENEKENLILLMNRNKHPM